MAKKPTWGESWDRLRSAFELLIDTNLHLRESEGLREAVMIAWEKVKIESAINGLRLPDCWGSDHRRQFYISWEAGHEAGYHRMPGWWVTLSTEGTAWSVTAKRKKKPTGYDDERSIAVNGVDVRMAVSMAALLIRDMDAKAKGVRDGE